ASMAMLMMLGSLPAPAAAATTTSTASAMSAKVLSWLNRDRAARGLVPLRSWTKLRSVAADRAARMVATNTLSHAAAGGNVGTALTARGIQWYRNGEIIGASTYPWGSQAAANIYSLWKGSSTHRSLMFSSKFNYVGIAFAYRSASNTTYVSVVFSESKDHTAPVARNVSLTRSGTTIRFAWTGADRRLQTHTAGLRSFDVQYRVGNGTWRTIRNDTTAKALTLYRRAHGHWYSFRVQSADRRGNLSRWTSTKRIWVP
ncbi:MAG: CAP domain-containing protein, partial [Chloroflexi bacterium]|nr:CAP domain-containing protein [Chloroflexota bacterium]